MEKKSLEIDNKFTDLAECTEYYYDELGKLDATAEFLKKKEKKRLHEYIVGFLFTEVDTLHKKSKALDKVEKTAIKEFNQEYADEHDVVGFWPSVKRAFISMGKPFKALASKVTGKSYAKVQVIEDAEPRAQISSSPAQTSPEATEEPGQENTPEEEKPRKIAKKEAKTE